MTQTSKWQAEYPSETLTSFSQTMRSQHRRPRALKNNVNTRNVDGFSIKLINVVGGTGVYNKLNAFCDLHSRVHRRSMKPWFAWHVHLYSCSVHASASTTGVFLWRGFSLYKCNQPHFIIYNMPSWTMVCNSLPHSVRNLISTINHGFRLVILKHT
jgi:hypothetical protein